MTMVVTSKDGKSTSNSIDFLALLENSKPRLSKAEKIVVDYVLSDPRSIIHLSITGLAELCGVSVATVVRTCRSLGFDGYQDFKVTLAGNVVTAVQSIHEDIEIGDSTDIIADKVFQSAVHTINSTRDVMNTAAIDKAVYLLMNARKVLILGLGNSHSITMDLQHKLLRVGIDATSYTDSHLQAIAATIVKPGDVVFAISHSGSSKDVVDSARLAKSLGAKVISLTNAGASPLSEISDVRLFTSSSETKYHMIALSSRIAQMAIIDVIYTCISTKLDNVSERFTLVDSSLETKRY